MLKPGTRAPDFASTDQDGKPVGLADFRGRWLVLYFYPRDLTYGCTKEAMGFRDVKPRLEEMGACVVGVSTDPAEQHRHFISRCALNFTLLEDPDRSICRAYGALGPIGGIIDQASRITYIIDPDGVVAKSYHLVNPLNHPVSVLHDLDRLRQERKGVAGSPG